jgi:hypothetical protein
MLKFNMEQTPGRHQHQHGLADTESHDIHPEYKEGTISSRNPDDESEESDKLLYELEECIESEIKGTVHYSKLAMEAEADGHPDLAYTFYELAKDKLECAEYVRMRLIELDHYEPLKQKNIEDRLDRAKHLFRRL